MWQRSTTYTKQDNVRLTRENSEWERRVAVESERRQAAELKISELKLTIQQLQIDNGKLEKHIDEWKLIAEESKSNADKYCREMNKIFTALDQVKSELACTSKERTSRIGSLATVYKRASLSIDVVDTVVASWQSFASDFQNLHYMHAISYRLLMRLSLRITLEILEPSSC